MARLPPVAVWRCLWVGILLVCFASAHKEGKGSGQRASKDENQKVGWLEGGLSWAEEVLVQETDKQAGKGIESRGMK